MLRALSTKTSAIPSSTGVNVGAARKSANFSLTCRATAASYSTPSWATVDPESMGKNSEPYAVSNLVGGKWQKAEESMEIPHPLDKDAFPIFSVPNTQVDELTPFFESLRQVPKSGVHNPLKNPHRYVEYGEISRRVRISNSKKPFAR